MAILCCGLLNEERRQTSLTHFGSFLAFDEHKFSGVVAPRRVYGEDWLVVGQDSSLDARSRSKPPAAADLVISTAGDAGRLGTQREPSGVLCPSSFWQRLNAHKHSFRGPDKNPRSETPRKATQDSSPQVQPTLGPKPQGHIFWTGWKYTQGILKHKQIVCTVRSDLWVSVLGTG